MEKYYIIKLHTVVVRLLIINDAPYENMARFPNNDAGESFTHFFFKSVHTAAQASLRLNDQAPRRWSDNWWRWILPGIFFANCSRLRELAGAFQRTIEVGMEV